MRELFLNQLISGMMINRSEIKKRASFLELDLNYDYFKVAVFKCDSPGIGSVSVEELELRKISVISVIETVFKDLDVQTNCSQDSEDNILVLLKFNSTNDINEVDAIIEQTIEDLRTSIENYLKIPVSIGIGRRYDDIANIGMSYKEALEALSYRFLRDDNPVIRYSDISGSEVEKLVYPIEMEQKIIELIKLNDYDKAILVLNDMIGYIMERNKNFQHIEICLSNICGIIERCLFELNLNIHKVLGENYSSSFSIDKFKNIRQFTEWIISQFRLIIDHQINQAKDNAGGFVNEIKEYIDKYYSQELSLLTVAEHFKYSLPYFCKIFKEKMGLSFWEYVSRVRIEKSKTLLTETDISIEKIAQMVGYNNRFSYIRTFKKYVLITPGEYRMKYRTQK